MNLNVENCEVYIGARLRQWFESTGCSIVSASVYPAKGKHDATSHYPAGDFYIISSSPSFDV